MIITVFSDRPPDFRGILPFIKKNWLIIGEKQSRCRFSNSQVTIAALFILKFNDCLASLLSGPGLAAPLGAYNIDCIESLYSFIDLLIHYPPDIFHMAFSYSLQQVLLQMLDLLTSSGTPYYVSYDKYAAL